MENLILFVKPALFLFIAILHFYVSDKLVISARSYL